MQTFPVIETVLSVQFEPLPELRTAQLGLLWQEYRSRFSVTKEQHPLDPTFERFPASPSGRAGLRLQTVDVPPVPRLWFITPNGEEMIQVQQDRFIKNWRKDGGSGLYPRYENLRSGFDADFDTFRRFLRQNELGTPVINQCEVTYVNHLLLEAGWEHFGDLEKVFTFWSPRAEGSLARAEDFVMHTRYVIPGSDGKPIGRLHVDIQPAIRTLDQRPMYVMNLTARGQIDTETSFLDIGHKWIVRTFKNLTHPDFHGAGGGGHQSNVNN